MKARIYRSPFTIEEYIPNTVIIAAELLEKGVKRLKDSSVTLNSSKAIGMKICSGTARYFDVQSITPFASRIKYYVIMIMMIIGNNDNDSNRLPCNTYMNFKRMN